MPEISVSQAEIIGLFLESVFYGIYLVSCPFCWLLLLRKGSRRQRSNEVNWIIVVASLVLFVIATLDLSLHLYQNMFAFVFYTGEGGAIEAFTISVSTGSWITLTRVSSDSF